MPAYTFDSRIDLFISFSSCSHSHFCQPTALKETVKIMPHMFSSCGLCSLLLFQKLQLCLRMQPSQTAACQPSLRSPFKCNQMPKVPSRLPRMHKELHKVCDSQCIAFNCIANPNAGEVLQHAKSVVQEILTVKKQLFKIGITHVPYNRMFNTAYGYSSTGRFKWMVIVSVHVESGFNEMLEASLIDYFNANSKCKNKAKGGETAVGEPPFFTYVVANTLPSRYFWEKMLLCLLCYCPQASKLDEILDDNPLEGP